MSNPYLPNWEYMLDAEPRVFGNIVYVYGSHDSAESQNFCDFGNRAIELVFVK